MAHEADIEAKFWKELKGSPVVMLGLDGVNDGRSQPMTAFFDGIHAPLWFFTSRQARLATHVLDGRENHPAIVSYTAKGHDLFASIHGRLSIERDRIFVDRFWDDRVADWYEGGRGDPNLVLLRLDADQARIWLSASEFAAPIRRLFGKRPLDDYGTKVAEVLL